jgi:hypothetical protein
MVNKKEGHAFLEAAEKKNLMLLLGTKKDIDLLEGVYGVPHVRKHLQKLGKKPRTSKAKKR